MKQLSSVVALGILIIASAYTLLVQSCNSHSEPKFIPKTDTVDVVACVQKGSPIYVLKGVYKTYQTFSPVSANSKEGKYTIDTSWTVRTWADTLRSPDGKPLFDAAHQPLPRWAWQQADKNFIQKIDVPRK